MVRLPLSPFGSTLPRMLRWALVGTLSIALCLGADVPVSRAESPSAAPVAPSESGAASSGDSDGDGSPDRPDVVSAGVSARLLGVAVEDLSQRSGSVRVWVNPDGTLQQESYASPVWVSVDGRWVDVDYSLVAGEDGTWVPRAAPVDVVIGNGGSREFARMELPDGGSTVWSWPEVLPAPSVSGSSVTFEWVTESSCW
jgi:hypothetical protein